MPRLTRADLQAERDHVAEQLEVARETAQQALATLALIDALLARLGDAEEFGPDETPEVKT